VLFFSFPVLMIRMVMNTIINIFLNIAVGTFNCYPEFYVINVAL
jgi:hypothetical protein